MLLPDYMIHELSNQKTKPMIQPFVGEQVKLENNTPIISYGLSSFGYDIRLGEEVRILPNFHDNVVLDPKQSGAEFSETRSIHTVMTGNKFIVIPPNSFVLGHSVERICVPKDVLVVCLGKSTYARCGIIVNVTPLEPEWEGHITLEFSNTTNRPVRLYLNEGCCQLLFHKGVTACEVSYADRKGKYQDQPQKVVTAKV